MLNNLINSNRYFYTSANNMRQRHNVFEYAIRLSVHLLTFIVRDMVSRYLVDGLQ